MLTHIHVTDTVCLLLIPDVAGMKNLSIISLSSVVSFGVWAQCSVGRERLLTAPDNLSLIPRTYMTR